MGLWGGLCPQLVPALPLGIDLPGQQLSRPCQFREPGTMCWPWRPRMGLGLANHLVQGPVPYPSVQHWPWVWHPPAFPTQIHYTHTVTTSSAPHSASPSLHPSCKAHGIVPSPHHGHILPAQQPAPVPAAAPAVPWAPRPQLLCPRWALLKVLARLDVCAWGHTCCIRPGVHSASPIPPAVSIQRCYRGPQCGSGWESITAVLREAVGTVCPGPL